MIDYFKMVVVYLKQELPVQYAQYLEFNGKVIKYNVPEHEDFEKFYEQVKDVTESYVMAIRERKADLYFTFRKSTQERDFIVYR